MAKKNIKVEQYSFSFFGDENSGYKVVELKSDEEIAEFYKCREINVFDLLINQYCIIIKDGEVIDKVRWNGSTNDSISYLPINNDFTGKVKPRNIHQELAFDMLQNDEITIKTIVGGFGTGKDFIMIANAIQMLRDNKIEKIVWVRNNIEVRNTNPIGHLPDGLNQKLMPFALVLADHLGGTSGLEMFMNQGKIEIQHLGFIRGRDIKNSIIYCSEAENMTKEHVQLLIGRVGEGSSLWLNGDFKQVDSKVFQDNNGLNILVDKLKGNKRFGVVKLLKTERSETAALADLLD